MMIAVMIMITARVANGSESPLEYEPEPDEELEEYDELLPPPPPPELEPPPPAKPNPGARPKMRSAVLMMTEIIFIRLLYYMWGILAKWCKNLRV